MPLYLYKCDKCERAEEQQRLIAARDFETPCMAGQPPCGGLMQRQVSAPAFTVEGYSYRNGYQMPGIRK